MILNEMLVGRAFDTDLLDERVMYLAMKRDARPDHLDNAF
jgi:hypothetical protein